MVKVTFLGTSDQIPSRTRNHTSILLTHEGENILVDCGEGTQRQFRYANLNPCKITKILITHWHGDHVLGLPGLLSTLALSGYQRELKIYVPFGVKRKLEDALKVFSFYREYSLVIKEIGPGKFFEGKDFYLEAEEMEHSVKTLAYNFIRPSYLRIDKEKLKKSGLSGRIVGELSKGKDVEFEGKKFKFKNMTYFEPTKKISIVLDTRDNPRIMPFVKDADLFISEATYSGELEKEAFDHFHMTVPLVAKIAKKAKVGRLILAHVSSRYLKDMKSLLKEAKNIFDKSFLPRDLDNFEV